MAEAYWNEAVSPADKAIMAENRRRLPDEELAAIPPGQRFIQSFLRDAPRTWYDSSFDASALWEGVEFIDDYARAAPILDVDITDGLQWLDRPVFLAPGRHDFRIAPPQSWNPYRSRFQDLHVEIFEQSGHWPQLEQPARRRLILDSDGIDEWLDRWAL